MSNNTVRQDGAPSLKPPQPRVPHVSRFCETWEPRTHKLVVLNFRTAGTLSSANE